MYTDWLSIYLLNISFTFDHSHLIILSSSSSDRNFALAHFMKENHAFPKDTNVGRVMDLYFQVYHEWYPIQILPLYIENQGSFKQYFTFVVIINANQLWKWISYCSNIGEWRCMPNNRWPGMCVFDINVSTFDIGMQFLIFYVLSLEKIVNPFRCYSRKQSKVYEH